jgi:hypothetical protein
MSGSTHTPFSRPQTFFYRDVFGHEFGQDLVLQLDPALQLRDPVRRPTCLGIPLAAFEGRVTALEELLLPAVELRRVDAVFVAHVRYRPTVQQVLPQDRHLLLRAEMPSFPVCLTHYPERPIMWSRAA